MVAIGYQQRFDQFQDQAVANIVSDFSKKPHGRFLLVIPTGGGKTFTAVKAVNRLFENGILDAGIHRVLWTAHRNELIVQAKNNFSTFESRYPGRPSFRQRVDFGMISAADGWLAKNTNIGLVVLDEAHHASPKNITYGPIFKRTNIGILGLTATPSRHDGEPLEFERESFSIGFPDLVKRGIVLKPIIRKVEDGVYEIRSLDSDESLEQLNNRKRNQEIIDGLLKYSEEYQKIIIYVGTTNHAKELCKAIMDSKLRALYESISYITGNTNSRSQERIVFIEQEKKYKRSILVNVMVLSEGYDDPTINTVVMATPSNSKLYYMQAMGRAIRMNPDDPFKKAYCVEVEDKLPNIRYRIDNRWLFADISDALEPAVLDKEYGTEGDFGAVLDSLYEAYSVPKEDRTVPSFNVDVRYSLLLFRRYIAPDIYWHFPVVITNDNRLQVSNLFNFLSERMESFKKNGIVSEEAFRMVGDSAFAILREQKQRMWVYDAMRSAVPKERLKEPDEAAEKGNPWITFVALHFLEPEMDPELLEFTKEMVNRNDIMDLVRSRDFEPGSFLIRLPLPLAYFWGKIVTSNEFSSVDTLVKQLRELRTDRGNHDHRMEVRMIVDRCIIPLEHQDAESLVRIARTDEEYSFPLK